MAQKSKSRTSRKSSYRGFEGVDLKKTHSGDESIAWINNFRITEDGSLKKRSGFKSIYTSTQENYTVSASYCDQRNGTPTHYFVEGNIIKKYIPSTNELTDIGEISEDHSTPFFFEFLDSIFLCDGIKIFKVDSSSITENQCYIPLYGKDWPSGVAGELYEPLNLLTPKVAISYKFTEPATSYLSLGGLTVSSIDAVYRNGTLLTTEDYSLNETFNMISLSKFEATDVFLAILTITPNNDYNKQKNELFSSRATSTFYELNKNNLFFWGSSNSNKIFYSVTVNESVAKTTYPFVSYSKFYIPLNSYFTVGAENDKINSFIRHYDRVLIMTESSTWITNLQDLENNSLKLKNINSVIGCSVFNGCTRIENTLVSVGRDNAYFWTSDTDELNECNAYSISDPIKELIPSGFFSSCILYYNSSQSEVWFCGTKSQDIWIYNLKRKAWYSFSGFSPYAFLTDSAEVTFFEDKRMCVFNASLSCDIIDEIEKEITATFKSGELEFNSREKKKLCTATVRGSFSTGSLCATIVLDGKKSFTADLTPPALHSIIPFRIRSGSFRSLTLELSASGKGSQIIHGIELDAD